MTRCQRSGRKWIAWSAYAGVWRALHSPSNAPRPNWKFEEEPKFERQETVLLPRPLLRRLGSHHRGSRGTS